MATPTGKQSRGEGEETNGIGPFLGRGTSTGSFLRRVTVITCVVAAAAVVVLSLKVLFVLFGGLLLGAFLVRLTQLVQRVTKWPYGASLALVWFVLLGTLACVGYLFGTQLATQVDGLMQRLGEAAGKVASALEDRGWLADLKENFPAIVSQTLQSFDTTAFFGGFFSSIGGGLTALGVIVFVGFFLSVNPGIYRRGALALVPEVQRPWVGEILSTCVDTLWWWMVGRLFAMVVIGIAAAVGLWALGVPMAVMLGIVAGLVSFIPLIGAVLAIIPAMLVAFLQGTWVPVYVLALYLAIQAVENNLLTPFVEQRMVNVPPVLLIASQLLLGLLVGLIGVAIAAPVAATGLVLINKLYIEPIANRNGQDDNGSG